jgi:uncharacterized protein YdhG (YjbR/CyaY superfamily)
VAYWEPARKNLIWIYERGAQGVRSLPDRTIRFQPVRPLPASLVRKLVKARIARNAGQQRRASTARRR